MSKLIKKITKDKADSIAMLHMLSGDKEGIGALCYRGGRVEVFMPAVRRLLRRHGYTKGARNANILFTALHVNYRIMLNNLADRLGDDDDEFP